MSVRSPKAIVRLDVGDREEQIYIYEGDDVHMLVEYFCERHGLGKECFDYVTMQVNNQIKDVTPFDISSILAPQQESLRSKIQSRLLEHHYDKIQRNKHKKNSSIYDKLYTEAIEMQQNREETFQIQRRDGEERDMKEASFKPLVSPSNDLIVSKLKRNQTHLNISDYLYEESSNLRQRKEFAIESRLNEIAELTSKPYRTPRSKVICNKLRRSKSVSQVHERLYQQAEVRAKNREKESQEHFKKHHPFKPVRSRSPKGNRINQPKGDVCPKLLRVEPIKEVITFQPSINHDQYYQRVARKKEIEDRVLAHQIKIGQIQIQVKSKSPIRISKPKLVSKIQNKVTNQDAELEWTIVQKVFNLLDSDHDGLISSREIDLSQISFRVLEFIACVLMEMEENELVLDVKTFYQLCGQNGIIHLLVAELKQTYPAKRYDLSQEIYQQIIRKQHI